MGQTNAIYGLSGIGFLDPVAETAIGFSSTATTLKITGGFEAKMQKNSAGIAVASFYQVADATVEIEGITDATIGLMARLMGGTLLAGTAALPAARRALGRSARGVGRRGHRRGGRHGPGARLLYHRENRRGHE